MKFGNRECNKHYNEIKKIVADINREKHESIKFFPLRIDKFKNGSAYKIPDEILNKIEDSGLLIADLTHKNENVYHEIGYLMGLNKMRQKHKLNLILICNTTVTTINDKLIINEPR